MKNIYIRMGKQNKIYLYKPFSYKDITVPKNFKSDGNSIPRVFRFFIGNRDYPQAFFIHDFMYSSTSTFTDRKKADRYYTRILIELGYPKYKAYILYLCIRMFGRLYWKNNK